MFGASAGIVASRNGYLTNCRFQTFVMYQLVSMNLYVVVKNIQSSTYESIVVNLYVVDTKPIVRVGKS